MILRGIHDGRMGEILRVSSITVCRSEDLNEKTGNERVNDTITGLEALSSRVSRHMRGKGIEEATDPQKEAFQPILSGEDVLLIAPTGFGKTEAAFAPLLQKLHEEERKGGIGLLYIAPLRALNRDMLQRMDGWCKDLDLTIGVRHSDTTQSERNRQARKPPDVLVTTPETLQIMFTGSRLRKGLQRIEYLILDEIHELYGDERGAQLDLALSRLDVLAGRRIQRIGLSATIQDPEEVSRFLVGGRDQVRIIMGNWTKDYSFEVDSPPVTEEDSDISRELGCTPKVAAVVRRVRELAGEYNSILMFVNSRDLAEAFTTRLRAFDPDLKVGIHHGSLSREARLEMENDFKSGDLKLLVCTSSMELGMDIGAVDLVIQFKSPKEVSRLLQRAGRAGHRIGDTSKCIVLATEPDDILESGVIAKLALMGDLEREGARKNILSVLANQIISTASAEKAFTIDEFFEMVRKTYTFSDLDHDELVRIIKYLHSNRLVFYEEDGGIVKGGRISREYFHSNISMIPDERVMMIRDLSTRKVIGTLDMDFVLSNLEPYSKFIVRGQPWRVVEIGDEEITVEPVTDLGPVPAWSGSDIPVPFEVAVEVGKTRHEIVNDIENGKEIGFEGLPLTERAQAEILRKFREQVEEDFTTPDSDTITIEIGQEGIVIGICGGTRVNETIGRVIAALLSARYGGNIVVDYDPYRILLTGDLRIKANDIEWALSHAPVDEMEYMVPVLLRNSPLLRWQMIHVAKKFGVLRGDVDPKRFPLKRLLSRWKETPVMEEATGKIMHERLDIERSSYLLESIMEGRTGVVIQKVSPLSMSGALMRGEFMTPGNAGSEVVKAVRERLMTTASRLTCMNCGSILRATPERARNIAGCHKCGSRLMAPIPPVDIKTRQAVEKGLKKKRLNAEEKKRFQAALMAAQLFSSYGYKAVLALAGRGIGPKTAGRILEVLYDDEEELIRRIFGDEIKYARTRRFWD
jgi:ATP-dependent Lhr-like helicase